MPSWIENAFWRKGIAETHYHNDQQCHFARYLCTPPVQLHRGAWRDPRFRTGLPIFYLVPNLHTSLCQPFGRRCAIGMASTRRRCRVKHLFPQQDPLTATCPLVAGACWSDAIQPIKNIGAQFNTEVPSRTKNRQRTAGRGEECFLGLISVLFFLPISGHIRQNGCPVTQGNSQVESRLLHCNPATTGSDQVDSSTSPTLFLRGGPVKTRNARCRLPHHFLVKIYLPQVLLLI